MAEQIEQAARTAGRTFNITLAELAGANAGQRNDLLALNQAVYRVPDGTLYTSTGSQLVPAQGLPVTASTNPLTGGIELIAGGVPLVVGGSESGIGNDVIGSFLGAPTNSPVLMTFPNPYPAQANAPVHPAVLFFENGWNGYKYWVAFTPYPGYNSDFENPSVVASNDFKTWVSPGVNPLVGKPPGGAYNADTHLFMSADNTVMYLCYRERGVGGVNNLEVMHSANGVTWTAPVAILSGALGTQDFGSPSIWWNGTGWTCISHNLDAVSPWPMQRRVSNSANVYGTWGSPVTVSAPPKPGRAWWHSFFVRTNSGQIFGLLQDNNGAAGASGSLYLAESGDDGLSFGIQALAGVALNKYRSCFCILRVFGQTRMRIISSNYDQLICESFDLELYQSKNSDLLEKARGLISAPFLTRGNAKLADTFVRADSVVSLGLATSGNAYNVYSGTFGISGNAAYPVTSAKISAEVNTTSYNVGVQFFDMTAGAQQWLMFRVASTDNFLRIGVQSPTASGSQTLTIQSIVSGGIVLNTSAGFISREQYLSVINTPSRFEIYVDGVLQYSTVSGVHANATQIGLQANAGATSKYRHLTCESHGI